MKRITRTLQRLLTVLTAAGICAAAMPFPASAGTLSEYALIQKYAEYGWAEAHAPVPVGLLPAATGDAAIRIMQQTAIIMPLHDGTDAVRQSTLGAETAEFADGRCGYYNENEYRIVIRRGSLARQFFRNCRYENGFYYILTKNGTASVVGADSDDFLAAGTGRLEIPARLGGAAVTRIENRAFSEIGAVLSAAAGGLREIILPDTVETIGVAAFESAGGGDLHIRLPESVRAIQTLAFWGAEAAVADEYGVIELPESLEFLGYRVFSDRYALPVKAGCSYVIKMPQSPVYLDAESYSGGPRGKSIADMVGAYRSLEDYLGEVIWEKYCAAEDKTPFDGMVQAYEAERAYLDLLADSGKYDLTRPFWGTGVRYMGGGVLYDEANIVTKRFSADYDGEAALVLPDTDPVRGAVQPIGDINGDGWLSVADAIMLARFIAEDAGSGITQQGTAEADLDLDGAVTGLDLVILLERIADVNA